MQNSFEGMEINQCWTSVESVSIRGRPICISVSADISVIGYRFRYCLETDTDIFAFFCHREKHAFRRLVEPNVTDQTTTETEIPFQKLKLKKHLTIT